MHNRTNSNALIRVRRLLIAGSAEWRHSFNRHLVELAKAYGLKVEDNENLFGIAVQSAIRAGTAHHEAEEVAAEGISRLVARQPEKPDWSSMAMDYIVRTILPSIITSLKKTRRNLTLADLKRDHRIQSILEAFPSITDKMLSYRMENSQPNKILKSLDTIGEATGRGSIFEEADPRKPLIPLWAKATFNQSVEILRERNRIKDTVSRALRFKVDDDDATPGLDPERLPELSTEDFSKHERQSLVEEFRRRLDRIDHRYRPILKLMGEEGIDPTSPRHQRQFEQALHLDHDEFLKLTRKFIGDLKHVFKSLDVDFDEGAHLLRSAKKKVPFYAALYPEFQSICAMTA